MHLYAQLIFKKGVKAIQRRKRVFLQQMVITKMDIHLEEINLISHFKSDTKIKD